MFEKLKERLFNIFYKNKAHEIEQIKEKNIELVTKKLDLESQLDDINKTHEANRPYITIGAEKSFEKLNDTEKEHVINQLGYLNQGELRYIEAIEDIARLPGNNQKIYGNDDIEKIIKSYKEKESISKETWNTINSKHFAEMSYEEGESVNRIMEELKQEKIENAKGLFDRKGMESYFERNNITDELRNNYDFINLVNANFGLESMLFDSKEFYKSNLYDCWSPDEISDFQDWSKEEKKELRLNFENDKVKAYENMKKYDTLLNFVNKEVNKMVGRDIEKIDERFNDVQEFKTNKELQFEDGSIIKEGTSFIIEGFPSDVGDDFGYGVHFEPREGNIYNRENGTGEGYYLSERKLVEFTELVEPGVDYSNVKELGMTIENEKEIISENIEKEINNKGNIIGKIDYLAPSGDIAETIEYTDAENFRNTLDNCLDCGVPIKVSDYSEERIYKSVLEDFYGEEEINNCIKYEKPISDNKIYTNIFVNKNKELGFELE